MCFEIFRTPDGNPIFFKFHDKKIIIFNIQLFFKQPDN